MKQEIKRMLESILKLIKVYHNLWDAVKQNLGKIFIAINVF